MVAVKTNKKRAKITHNQRYVRSELVIYKAVLKLLKRQRGRITVRQIAKETGLSRQTLYNHHPNINQAIIESEDVLLEEFTAELDTQVEKLSNIMPDANWRIFYATLIFMARRGDIFCPICTDINNQGLLYRVVEAAFPRLQIDWLPKNIPAPAVGSERVDIFIRMMVEVIARWGAATRCDIRKANRYVNRLLRITEDAERNRLP